MRSFSLSEIAQARAWLRSGNAERRDMVRGACFKLPDWFRLDLDPYSPEYRRQQLLLWSEVTGRTDYDPAVNEDTPEIGSIDGVFRPGYYQPGIASLAGDHLIALGHILRHSNATPASRILEYGAGFGQIALAFARLGARVETVDVNPAFCGIVEKLAERYRVNLSATVGQFGDAPTNEPGSYDLIYFYESLHHCLDFLRLIERLRVLLKDNGRIILAGEPITPDDSPLVPYPWGLRLDGETIVVTNQRGWMELGFRESFLLKQFVNEGFSWTRHDCPPSRFATLYVVARRAEAIDLKSAALTAEEAATWHLPDSFGRFTKERSVLFIDRRASMIECELTNFHPQAMSVAIGGRRFSLPPGARRAICVNPLGAREIWFESPTINPVSYGLKDNRELGIHVRRLRYPTATDAVETQPDEFGHAQGEEAPAA
jgi:SAM-dependent methyltransferase